MVDVAAPPIPPPQCKSDSSRRLMHPSSAGVYLGLGERITALLRSLSSGARTGCAVRSSEPSPQVSGGDTASSRGRSLSVATANHDPHSIADPGHDIEGLDTGCFYSGLVKARDEQRPVVERHKRNFDELVRIQVRWLPARQEPKERRSEAHEDKARGNPAVSQQPERRMRAAVSPRMRATRRRAHTREKDNDVPCRGPCSR